MGERRRVRRSDDEREQALLPAPPSPYSPAASLDDTPQAVLQPRFGHDFGQVAVEHMLVAPAIQTALLVNEPGDVYEQEAERVAEYVMRMPDLEQLQRGENNEEVEQIELQHHDEEAVLQRSSSNSVPKLTAELKKTISGLQGSGEPLAPATRAFMEPRFGHDFSAVRVHTDATAAQTAQALSAHAYTVGRNIVFSVGQYQPEELAGRRLLAHELSHVVQQGAPSINNTTIDHTIHTHRGMAGERVQRQTSPGVNSVSPETGNNQSARQDGNGVVAGDAAFGRGNVIELEPITIVGDPMSQDKMYEYFAHVAAYRDELTNDINGRLEEWGYKSGWQDKIDDRSTGFFAGLLMPQDEFRDVLKPVIAFRGSDELSDWMRTNLDVSGVGTSQFRTNFRLISGLIAVAGGRVDVTGHSLGGSLAQQVAAFHSSNVRRVVTFQSPGILPEVLQYAQNNDNPPEATHYISRGDFADFASGQHLPGEMYLYGQDTDPLTAHTRMLLTDHDKGTRVDPAEYKDERTITEGVRIGVNLTGALWIARTIDFATINDDVELRGWIRYTSEGDLAQYPTIQRAAVIDRLQRGITNDGDEQAILKLLHSSAQAGDIVSIFSVVELYQLGNAIDGEEFQQLRQVLQTHYFPSIDEEPAFALLKSCIDGATAEWEEELIADLLVSCPTSIGQSLVTRLGEYYRKHTELRAGLLVLKEQLDGAEWGRIVAVYGLP